MSRTAPIMMADVLALSLTIGVIAVAVMAWTGLDPLWFVHAVAV
jgi:hypothetical protein